MPRPAGNPHWLSGMMFCSKTVKKYKKYVANTPVNNYKPHNHMEHNNIRYHQMNINLTSSFGRESTTITEKFFPCLCASQSTRFISEELQIKQVAQLLSRDSAAAWVSFGQKWKTIFCRHYRSIFNHCDVIGLQSYQIR